MRTSIAGRRREIGLGGYPDVTLAQARERARDAKEQISRGIDPVEERRAIRAQLAAAQRSSMTFAEAADECLASKLHVFATPSTATSGSARSALMPCRISDR